MTLLNQPNDQWKKAHEMAAHLPCIRDKKAKHQQQAMILRQWLSAMKGGKR